jgi:hypothetical protein
MCCKSEENKKNVIESIDLHCIGHAFPGHALKKCEKNVIESIDLHCIGHAFPGHALYSI